MTLLNLLEPACVSQAQNCPIEDYQDSLVSLPIAKSNRLGVRAKSWSPAVLEDDSAHDPDENDTPFGAILPGHGDSGKDCGKSTICHCSKCGHYWETTSKCQQRECPECWKGWVVSEGIQAAARTWVLTNELYAGRHHRRIVHAAVSLPYEKGMSYSQMRLKATRIAMNHGLSGGCAITHTHRAKNGEYIPDGYVHFHIVGIALGSIKVFSKGESAPYLFKVIKDKRFNDFRGVRTYKELRKLISYQLSHCAIVKGRHALSYFGFLGYHTTIMGVHFNTNARFKEDYPAAAAHLMDLKTVMCPNCGSTEVDIILPWRLDLMDQDFHPEVTMWLKAHPR